jgi:AraC-like DNA-binding protein
MKKGQDIAVEYPNLLIIHQKVPGRELGRHCHKEHEIFIPLQGSISVSLEDKTNSCSSGKILYVPPNIEHSFSSSSKGEGERIILLVKDRLWKKSHSKKFDPTVMPLNSLTRELVFYLLLNPQTAYAKSFIAALTDGLIDQLLYFHQGEFENNIHLESRIKDERIKKVYQLITQGEDLALNILSKEAGLSTRNLNRLFLSEIGRTPKQFMIEQKIEKAKKLLKTSPMTITDIGFEVGYNSTAKFISAFQKVTGKLPSEFRATET